MKFEDEKLNRKNSWYRKKNNKKFKEKDFMKIKEPYKRKKLNVLEFEDD